METGEIRQETPSKTIFKGCYTTLPEKEKESLYGRFDNKGIGLKWVLQGMYLVSDEEFRKITSMLELAHTRNNERLRAAS